VRLADRQAHPVLGLRHADQVRVVRHQAVGPDLDPVLCASFRHEREAGLVVGVREKGLPAAVAVLGDVVRITRSNGSREAVYSVVKKRAPLFMIPGDLWDHERL
jgi:hypothetical protein